jgi:serine/threonine-protein kinase
MNASTLAVREWFERALEFEPDQRMHWLSVHCADPEQRAAVERLLAADSREDARVLDDPLEQLLGRVGDAAAVAPPAGTTIGAFTLL